MSCLEPNRREDPASLDAGAAVSGVGPSPAASDRQRDLPPFVPLIAPDFEWGSLGGGDFAHAPHSAYAEVVHWR